MRTIASGWDAYREHAIQPSMDVTVKRDLQAAFYAGAGFVVDELVDTSPRSDVPDAGSMTLTRWQSEMIRETTRTRRESEQL